MWDFISAQVYDPTKGVYEVVEKSLWEKKGVLFFELIVSLFIISATIFLTRMQRILGILLSPILFFVVYVIISGTLQGFVLPLVLFILFIVPIFLGILSLLIKFGNNSREKISKKPTPIRSSIAWGVYGLGLDFVLVSPMPLLIFAQGGIHLKFPSLLYLIFDLLDPIMQKLFIINPILAITFFFSFYPILFALIGYVIEKHKQKKQEVKPDEP